MSSSRGPPSACLTGAPTAPHPSHRTATHLSQNSSSKSSTTSTGPLERCQDRVQERGGPRSVPRLPPPRQGVHQSYQRQGGGPSHRSDVRSEGWLTMGPSYGSRTRWWEGLVRCGAGSRFGCVTGVGRRVAYVAGVRLAAMTVCSLGSNLLARRRRDRRDTFRPPNRSLPRQQLNSTKPRLDTNLLCDFINGNFQIQTTTHREA